MQGSQETSTAQGLLKFIESKWRAVKFRAYKILEIMPIVGHLSRCTKQHHKSSLREFIITILFGTATFWVTAIFLRTFSVNKELDFFELIYKTVSNGQLFIFAVGMLGPIVLSSAEDPRNSKQFPGRVNHFALIVLLGALAAGMYALVLAGREDVAKGMFDADFLFSSSVLIALVVVGLRYLTIVYRRSTVHFDAEGEMLAPVTQFAADFNERHPLTTTSQLDNAADAMVSRLDNKKGVQQ